MPDLIEQLESLPGLVGSGAPGPSDIRARARRRGRRRRLGAGTAIAALVAVVAVAAPWQGDDPAQRVTTSATDTASSSPPSTDPTPTVPATLPPGMEPSGLTASPVVELEDGQELTVSFEDPSDAGRASFVAVCDGEVVNRAFQDEADPAGLLAWCGPATTDVTDPVRVLAQRTITTPDGRVDCSANIGRCVVAAVLDAGGAKWSPIGFVSVQAPPVTIRNAPQGLVADGTTVEISGDGGLPGEVVSIRQCLPPAAGDDDFAGCSAIRGVEARVGDDGRYRADMILYRDLLMYAPDGSTASRWVPCEPCSIVAARTNGDGEPAAEPVRISSDGPAIHPTVEIVEPGPFVPGQRVTLRGSGFQPSMSGQISLELCPADLMSQPFRGDCVIVAGVGTPGSPLPEVSSAGTFTFPGVQLPGAETTTTGGLRCDADGACAFGSTPGEGIAYLLSGPIDLSG